MGRTLKKNFASLFAVAVSSGVFAASVCAEETTKAMADLAPTKGSKVNGTVVFEPQGDAVLVRATVLGLTPGKHGFHVHAVGDCSAPDGSSAGPHFDPGSKQHGAPTDAERHAGDLGNIEADASGVGSISWTDKNLKLSGPTSIIGKSVIVHENADDFRTQPTGNAGGRIACGVIKNQGSS